MSSIYGLMGIDPEDFDYLPEVAEPRVLFDYTLQYIALVEAEMRDAFNLFVQETTTDRSERYDLPITGEMDRHRSGALTRRVKGGDNYPVAYPIWEYDNGIGATRVDYALMPPAKFQAAVDGIITRYMTRVRNEILRATVSNVNYVFKDEKQDYTVRRLANQDGTLYLPVTGSTLTELNNYIAAGYTTISTSNNPIADYIKPYFGPRFGISANSIVTFHSASERSELEGVAGYMPFAPDATILNSATEYASGAPNIPGDVHGRIGGVVLSEWDGVIPDDYLFSMSLLAPAPLKMRVDPAGSGLGEGGLVYVGHLPSDHRFDLDSWNARFGFGVGNRLNGQWIQLTLGAYTVPSIG